MEVTKKEGDPDPSAPQGDPSASSQKLGTDLNGPQGLWINSGSRYFKQGLSLSTEAVSDGACSPSCPAHTPDPVQQRLQDPAEVSSTCGYELASQDALTLSGLFPSPIVHLVTEDGTMALPLCMSSDSTSDVALQGFCHSQLQVQVAREGKAPARVLVGWGKGPCGPDQIAPLDIRKSRWIPCFLSVEDGSAAAQGNLLALAQDQGQGKCLCLSQAPSSPTKANTPELDTTPVPAAVEPYSCKPYNMSDSIAITNGLTQDNLLRKCGHQWSVSLESPKVVISCRDKVNFYSQEEPPTPTPTPKESPDHVQELEVATRQVLPKQPENPAEKPLVSMSRPGSPTPVSGSLGTSKCPRSSQEMLSSQPDQRPLRVCSNTCSSVPHSAYQVSCHKQSPIQSPREAVQIPASSVPSCQLRDTVEEDQVLVFDITTGITRMGLLCHDPTGSWAVLVGLMPSHPSLCPSENMLSTQPLDTPILSPASNRSSLWSTMPMVSSPVPSSLSSGSYQEVVLVPKEARLTLESPGTETAIRVGMLMGPVPLQMPLQFGERTLSSVHDPGSRSKPGAEENESTCAVWIRDMSGMRDTSKIQAKKPQWMNSEQAPSAKSREAPSSLLLTAHPDHTVAEGMGQVLLAGGPPLAERHLLTEQLTPTGHPPFPRQRPLSGQMPPAQQPPSTKHHPISGQPPLTGTPLTRQLFLTGQPPFPQEPPNPKEPILSRGPTITREPGRAPILCQEGECWGLPPHVGVLRVPLTPEKTRVYASRDKVGTSTAQGSSTHQQARWQPGSPHRAQEKQLPLVTFTTPDTGCKVFPVAMVGTEAQGPRVKLTEPSMVAHLGLLCGACYELASTAEALPAQSPVLCRPSLGPCQDMAAVVIDTGTGFTKCGLAGENPVLSVVPSRVQLRQQPALGQPRHSETREAIYSVLNRGVVSDWDALEVLWQHLFYCRLGMLPEELAVLVADSPISPRSNREKVAEILFERFHVPAMQTVHQALLALYAYGRTTGLVLGSGHGTSYVAPILTGDLAPCDIYRLDVAGADLTEYLAQLLLAGGHSPPEAGLVNQIKEACCYVAMDMTTEMARTQARQPRVDFVLPDKQVITLGSERFCCPEALFQPDMLGLNQPGLPQLALLSISRLEAKQQEQLLANVVLDGGSTLVSGFPERLRQELGPRATVLGSPYRAVAAWIGGSIMASRDAFQSLWLSRHEYEEEGPWAIYKYRL